jgi:hypothetical protein
MVKRQNKGKRTTRHLPTQAGGAGKSFRPVKKGDECTTNNLCREAYPSFAGLTLLCMPSFVGLRHAGMGCEKDQARP